jgi:hypothetical protein
MNLSPDTPFSQSVRRSNWRTVRFDDVVRNVDEAVRDPLTCDLLCGPQPAAGSRIGEPAPPIARKQPRPGRKASAGASCGTH